MQTPNILSVIADNPALFDAVKALILAEFQSEPGRTDESVSDAQLGQMFRARLVGIQRVDEAFRKILTFKTYDTAGPGVNRAR